MKNRICIFMILAFAICIVADEVVNLPGLPPVTFKHYSGYLKASKTHFLHYWYVESQRDPVNDPLVLWMNGGPGCSSLDGMLEELGPFQINDDAATFKLNPYSWNREANVLFLEAPAGVGFSYSTDGNVTTDDNQVSSENYAALKDFFAQFPHLKSNDFFITGESYGGIYVPTLAKRVVQGLSKYPLKFKGVAIGNGMLDFDMNTDTLIEFAYHHGLVDQKTWDLVQTVCCQGCTDTCDFHDPQTSFCNKTLTQIVFDIYNLGLNMYDLYQDCYSPVQSSVNFKRFHFDMRAAFPKFRHSLHRFMHEARLIKYDKNPSELTRDAPPCLNETAITIYLNRQDVRRAIFIPDYVQTWEVCSTIVGTVYKTVYQNMRSHIQYLLSAGLNILVYNGDTDMACNFMMGQQFVSQLNRPLIKGKHPWMVNGQVAGYATNYKNIDFVTVKGTGHMVPQWKPAQAYTMIKSFLDNTRL